MKFLLSLPLAALCASAVIAPLHANEDPPPPASMAGNLTSLHDFDFFVGDWRVHHRRLKERLADNHEWVEFTGTCSMRKLMDGLGNVDDNVLNLPEGAYRAVSLRAYDPKTGLWAIWWLDGRNPHGELDPPVKGHFVDGVGIFETNDTLRGKPIRVRFTWSHITANSATWEQSFSPDAGKTWEMNWHMDLTRVTK
jgi:hypothetical protein